MDCEIVIYESDKCVFPDASPDPVPYTFQPSPVLEPYRSAHHFNFVRHVVTRAEYQEMGSEAARRKFRSANLRMSAGASADDGGVDSDGSIEPERKNASVGTNRSKKTGEERGAAPGKASANTRSTRTGSIKQSGREGTARKR